MEETDEAKILANVEVDSSTPCLPPSTNDSSDEFKSIILANAVANYDEDLQDIEDGFINRIDNQQDVDDAFDDDEPFALACAHLVIIDGDDTKDDIDDDFVVVNEEFDQMVHPLTSFLFQINFQLLTQLHYRIC
jgi:hypothetical protein